jgi:hypothetical protein
MRREESSRRSLAQYAGDVNWAGTDNWYQPNSHLSILCSTSYPIRGRCDSSGSSRSSRARLARHPGENATCDK